MSISVLTIVKNRADHLAQLVEGLRRSAMLPDELVIVDMGSDPLVTPPQVPFPVRLIRLEGPCLPLAAARNAAAYAATGDHLLFLDVDCIPMRDLVKAMRDQLDRTDGLTCAQVLYLGPTDARGAWSEDELQCSAAPHPARPFPAAGTREEANPGLFWSLVFGMRRASFIGMHGFDEGFTGYGAEDTDFGFRAQRAAFPLIFMGGAGAFHQYHDVLDPPLQHLDDIVRNARLFHERWNVWPMEGWLQAFSAMGLISWSEKAIMMVRKPDASQWAAARRCSPV